MAVLRLKRRSNGGGEIPPPPPPPISATAPGPPSPPPKSKPRLKKLRILFVLLGLGVLAVVSMIFGMMAAVSQDLPALYDFAEYKASKNSEVLDANGEVIGTLTSDQNKILLNSSQISPNIKNAVVAIEDARYYEHSGIDFQGIGRALVKDILSQSAAQGASTITEQFVKNALEAEGSRTILEKFREAALAYRLERHWSKDKILTEYLNTIYFGEGAYGIEAAARTYFGDAHPGCGTPTEPCASVLEPWEAATLAAIISSPSAYDPKVYPENALERRNMVLAKMAEQGYVSPEQMREGTEQALPPPSSIEPPTLDSRAPYFTAYLRQQLVERYGASKAFFGGLKVKSTLDMQLQEAAEEAVNSYLGYSPATASLVVIDNHNAGIKAMVGGPDFATRPFNLATQGHRQPGSSIKPFTLITALEEGISPYTVYPSEHRTFHFGKKGKEIYEVSNDEDSYLGSCDIVCATTYSDNSIYAALGLEGLKGKTVQDRTRSIAATIHKAGYDDPISTNPGMVLGGLEEGASPLGWAYAYSTIGNNGDRVSGTLAPRPGDSPVAYTEVTNKDGDLIKGGDNDSIHTQVFDEENIKTAKSILETVVSGGTGTNAQIGVEGQWGKTGTTENNGDAWFCGGVGDEVTACVWVGYPDSTTPMTTLYNGGPVMGGTFPALIWASVISAWRDIQAEHAAEKAARKAARGESEDLEGEASESESYEAPEGSEFEGTPEPEPEVVEPAPETEVNPEPAPEQAPEEAPEQAPEAAPEEAAPEPGGGVTAG
ncbi:MAG TPA: transglycosylase domain-containing protein [Solirubrobacterales bacterium]|jgi:penicillin-binding protein 1A|nr:transglycosylase domain-containing protein [Solirubrobacterales bacterium]